MLGDFFPRASLTGVEEAVLVAVAGDAQAYLALHEGKAGVLAHHLALQGLDLVFHDHRDGACLVLDQREVHVAVLYLIDGEACLGAKAEVVGIDLGLYRHLGTLLTTPQEGGLVVL